MRELVKKEKDVSELEAALLQLRDQVDALENQVRSDSHNDEHYKLLYNC